MSEEHDTGVEVELPATTGEAVDPPAAPAGHDGGQPRQRRQRRHDDDEGLSDRVKARLGKLASQRDRHRNAAVLEAERRAQLERENAELRQRLSSTIQTGLTWAETNAQQELERATLDAQAALEAGDGAKLADAQQRITRATLRQEQVAQAKPPQGGQHQPPQGPPHQQAPSESARMAAWKADNIWFGTDRAMTQAAVGHHHVAVAKGLQPESDEYFAEISRRMQADFPDAFDEDGSDAQSTPQPQRRMASTGVAPVPRANGGNPSGAGPATRVRLTPEQVATAQSLGITLEAYAKSLTSLQRKGRLQ